MLGRYRVLTTVAGGRRRPREPTLGTYIALLRGINVSGHRPVKMDRLRELLDALGHTDVSTYLQSGNVVFHTQRRTPGELASTIGRRIAKDLGLDVAVIVRTKQELAKVVGGNPFATRGVDAAHLHVTFLRERPTTAIVRAVEPASYLPDTFAIAGREVYLRCPNGYGRTKLNNAFFERTLGTTATTRNWKTVTALLDLAGGG